MNIEAALIWDGALTLLTWLAIAQAVTFGLFLIWVVWCYWPIWKRAALVAITDRLPVKVLELSTRGARGIYMSRSRVFARVRRHVGLTHRARKS
jgi:hypothetical protein